MVDTFTNSYRTNNEREFYVESGMLGATTSPQTANQIQEASSRLNAGVKHIELELISPELFDSVPKQHFEELKRMSELTGSHINIHAPAQMDLAGFAKEGWSEGKRKEVEESMKHMIDRGADLGAGTVVNFHSSGGIPAFEWQKEKAFGETEIPPEGKRKVFVIDQADSRHQIAPLEYEEREYFGGQKIWSPEERRKMLNKSTWDQEKLQLFNYEKEKAEINDRLRMVDVQLKPLIGDYEKLNEENLKKAQEILTKQEREKLDMLIKQREVMIGNVDELNTHMDTQLQDLHDKFSRFAPKKERDLFVKEYDKKFGDLIDFSKKELQYSKDQKGLVEKYGKNRREELMGELKKLDSKYGESFMKDLRDEGKEQKRRQNFLNIIQSMPTPNRYISTDEFAKDKLSETVSNSAIYAYNKYKDKAPVIAVENVFPDWTLGRADSLREAVEKSRELFADKLVKDKKVSRSKAEEISKKLIGATWDVGHITQLRKFGYSDKDIAREAERIAPVVKHIHVTDNFGFSDSHLAPGQGTVPIKEQLKKLREGLGDEYGKVAHIVESGGFASQFKQSPRLYELEYFNSPLYEMKAGPFWKDVAYTHAEYSMGYGIMFPEKHFDLYGAGFSGLPQELGGNVPGDKSRFAGTPNQ